VRGRMREQESSFNNNNNNKHDSRNVSSYMAVPDEDRTSPQPCPHLVPCPHHVWEVPDAEIEPHQPWSPLLNLTIPGPRSYTLAHHPWSPIILWQASRMRDDDGATSPLKEPLLTRAERAEASSPATATCHIQGGRGSEGGAEALSPTTAPSAASHHGASGVAHHGASGVAHHGTSGVAHHGSAVGSSCGIGCSGSAHDGSSSSSSSSSTPTSLVIAVLSRADGRDALSSRDIDLVAERTTLTARHGELLPSSLRTLSLDTSSLHT
jgi:hypothetical protein